MRRFLYILVITLFSFVLFACEESTEEKPDVFNQIAGYQNEFVTIVQYLGPTTDDSDTEDFIAWLESEGFEKSDQVWDFTLYGYHGTHHFERDDEVLTLDVFRADNITVLTTLEASLDDIDDLPFPEDYPEHGFAFDDDADLVGARFFLSNHPLAIAFYRPLDEDYESVFVYYTKATLDDLVDYYTEVLEAEGFTIDDFFEEDYIYIYAVRDGDVIELELFPNQQYEGFIEVYIAEFINY